MNSILKNDMDNLLNNFIISKESTYICKKCKDTGYILIENKAKVCSCIKIKKKLLPLNLQNTYLEKFKLSFYPKKIIDSSKSSSTYYDKAKKVFDYVSEFINDFNRKRAPKKGIFINGPVGSGKTFLVSIIYNELIKRKISSEFCVVPEFLEKSKQILFDNSLNENFINNIKKTKVLILDDLGAHNYTQWTINQLYLLFNYRLNNCLPTIITSNYNLNEIEELLDDRISSRLIELCKGYYLTTDQDIRFKKSKIER